MAVSLRQHPRRSERLSDDFAGALITSLDLLALLFAVLNVVLYFGLHNTWLIGHTAIVFYTLLALQCAVSLFRGDPWTMQFTRRVVDPEFLPDPRFRGMN